MDEYQKNRGYDPCHRRSGGAGGYGTIGNALAAVSRRPNRGALTLAAVAAAALTAGGWGLQAAQADATPPVTLTVTGPNITKAGSTLTGIMVQLHNPGLAVRDSRLSLTIHDGIDRALGADDIKIDVQEGAAWRPVQIEAIDGGVMGAIGMAGESHSGPHQSGGFAIGNNAKKAWQLRVRFRLAGHYKMVLTVSPDNGSTQLAQPASYSVEVL